jgi:hypothetical protein
MISFIVAKATIKFQKVKMGNPCCKNRGYPVFYRVNPEYRYRVNPSLMKGIPLVLGKRFLLIN